MRSFWSHRPPTSAARRRGYRLALESLEDRALPSITIQFDFSRDAAAFFNNPAAKQMLQLAANNLNPRLQATLTAIPPDAANGNTWQATFADPATGQQMSVPNLQVPANTLIVYVGGRPLNSLSSGSEAGE